MDQMQQKFLFLVLFSQLRLWQKIFYFWDFEFE